KLGRHFLFKGGGTVRDLINEYKESLRKVQRLKDKANDEDRSTLSGMERDLIFAIQWMETGRMPGSRRGAERRAAYEKEWPADPFRMDMPGKYYRSVGAVYVADFVSNYGIDEPEMDEDDAETIRLFIDDILSCLSEREREVFELRHVGGLEYHEIAEELGITEGHVKKSLWRANEKIEAWKKGEL